MGSYPTPLERMLYPTPPHSAGASRATHRRTSAKHTATWELTPGEYPKLVYPNRGSTKRRLAVGRGFAMVKSVFTNQYRAFLRILIAERKAAGVTQQALADRLGKPQSFVSKYERGERRLDVIEFILIVRALGADPVKVIRNIEQTL